MGGTVPPVQKVGVLVPLVRYAYEQMLHLCLEKWGVRYPLSKSGVLVPLVRYAYGPTNFKLGTQTQTRISYKRSDLQGQGHVMRLTGVSR